MESDPATVEGVLRLIKQLRPKGKYLGCLGYDTHLVRDLRLTSLDVIGLVYLCEKTYKVSLAGAGGLMARIPTVGQTANAIRSLQGLPPIEPPEAPPRPS